MGIVGTSWGEVAKPVKSGDLHSRFEIRGKLGSGGMAVVYLAFDHERGTEVALKMLSKLSGNDIYRFKREFRALADVAHPNLVGLYELHTIGDEWFLTMELVVGVSFIAWVRPAAQPSIAPPADEVAPTLRDLTDSTMPTVGISATPSHATASRRHQVIQAPLDLVRLPEALYQLCDTVHALHQAGKLHRDLKPSNVLVDEHGRVVVLDFGLVADMEAPDTDHTHEASMAVGTPAYMSPEQAANHPLTRASDWYAIGVMLYEALTGRRPIDIVGDRSPGLEEPVPPALTYNQDAPPHLSLLASALLAADPAARPSGEAVLAALGREPSAASNELAVSLQTVPFVGRERELEALAGAFARVCAGRGVALLVRAVSGMGKSALLRHYLDELAGERPDVVILRGRCYERESVPFKTLDAVVDALTSHLLGVSEEMLATLLPPDVEALARLFPAMRRVGAIADPVVRSFQPPDPTELRRRAFGALRALLGNLARRAPVVVALDDLQWGDTDSGNFLAELLLHPAAPPILMILAHRQEDEATSPLLAALRRARTALSAVADTAPMAFEELTLEPLSGGDARRLVDLVGGRRDPAHAREVIRDAGGSPLFLSEMMRSGTAAGSLDDALRARVARLPAEARALARVCAIAAKPLAQGLAVRAAGLGDGGRFLATLRAERLLRVRRTGDAEPELETYHDRIRAVLVGSLDEASVRRLHRQLATTLESVPRVDHEALVVHWLGAAEPAHAARHAALAAAAAEDRLAFHSAADLYALALAHGVLDADATRALRTRMAHALVHSGRLADAADAFALAAETATLEPERLELRRLELEHRLLCGQLEAGLALAGQLLEGLGFHVPSSRGRAILAMLWQRLRLKLRGLAFTERAEPSIAPEVLQRIDLLQSLSNGLSLVSPIYGRALQTQLVRETLDVGELHRVGVAFCLETGYLGMGGARGYASSLALGERTIELSRRRGDRGVEGHALAVTGLSTFLAGRWRQALELLYAAERVLRDHGSGARWHINLTEYFIASSIWFLGDARELVRLVSLYLHDAEERGDAHAQHTLRGWRTNVAWLVVDRPDEARAQLASVTTPLLPGHAAQVTHYYELTSEALIDLYEGKGAAAHARVEERWPALHAAMLARVQAINIEGHFLRARAALAAAADLDAAARAPLLALARRFAKVADGEGTDWARASATLARAGVARLAGESAVEIELLRLAMERFEAIEMPLYVASARHRLGTILGGDEGAALVQAATDVFAAQGIVNPPAIMRMLVGLASE